MTQSIPRGELSQDLESLQQILAQLQSAKDETALLQALSGYLQAHFGYPLVWLARFDPETQALTGDYQQFSSRQPVRETLTVLAGDLFDQTLLTRRPAIVPSLQDETRVGRWQKLAKRTGTQGAILQPIHHCKEPVGMLLVGSTHWGINPRKPERTHVSILAGTLGMVLHSIPINPMVPQPRQGQASLSAELPPLLTILTQLTAFDLQMAQVLSYLQRQHPEFSCGYYYLDEASQDWVSPTFLDPKDRRSNRGKAREHRLSARQNSSFFRYLASQSLLAISDVQASVDLRAPAPLTQHLEARSLLLQPILVQQALQGFLFLSHPQPRNWTELEKASLGIAANLLQLIWPPPSEEEISALPGTQEDRGLLSLPSPQSDPAAWESGIKRYFMEIERLFKARWVLLLRCDEETQSFEILLAQSSSRRSIPEFVSTLPPLSQVDFKLLSRSEQAVAIDDLIEDLRLVSWKEALQSLDLQSALIARAAPVRSLQSIILVGRDVPRPWTPEEIKALQEIAQAFQSHQEKHQVHVDLLRNQRLQALFREGLRNLQSARSSHDLATQSVQSLRDLLKVPLVGILLWSPHRSYAKVQAVQVSQPEFQLDPGTKVDLSDPLLQAVIAQGKSQAVDGQALSFVYRDLTTQTQAWLTAPLDCPLQLWPIQPQPKQTVLGAILVALPSPQEWQGIEHDNLQDFAQQIAWVLWSTQLNDRWRQINSQLETFIWYQQKVLNLHCQSLQAHLHPLGPGQSLASPQAAERDMQAIQTLCAQDSWALTLQSETISLVRLLREVLDGLEDAFQARQIWSQVHHLTQSNVTLNSSKPHLQMVLDEVLREACERSKPGGRIDLWSRSEHPEWLELSITDNGQWDSRLLLDLKLGHHRNRLVSSPADSGAGRRLHACQTIIQWLGGKLEFHRLEDGRSLSRFTLPLQINPLDTKGGMR